MGNSLTNAIHVSQASPFCGHRWAGISIIFSSTLPPCFRFYSKWYLDARKLRKIAIHITLSDAFGYLLSFCPFEPLPTWKSASSAFLIFFPKGGDNSPVSLSLLCLQTPPAPGTWVPISCLLRAGTAESPACGCSGLSASPRPPPHKAPKTPALVPYGRVVSKLWLCIKIPWKPYEGDNSRKLPKTST